MNFVRGLLDQSYSRHGCSDNRHWGKTLNVSAPGYCVLSLTGYQRPLAALCYRSQDISAPAIAGLVKEGQGFKDSNRGQSYWYGYWYEHYI